MALARYHASGFFRPTTFVWFAASAAVAVAGAFVYQAVVRWVPLIFISIFVCIGFGFVLGLAGAFAVKSGHCRNRLLALVFAVPLAGAGWVGSFYWNMRWDLPEPEIRALTP